ncbi:MAG TPA: hypothetical protein VL147_16420, partial [Devosia sp.]|nr:hypothetical protein [Devosia sp.]
RPFISLSQQKRERYLLALSNSPLGKFLLSLTSQRRHSRESGNPLSALPIEKNGFPPSRE